MKLCPKNLWWVLRQVHQLGGVPARAFAGALGSYRLGVVTLMSARIHVHRDGRT